MTARLGGSVTVPGPLLSTYVITTYFNFTTLISVIFVTYLDTLTGARTGVQNSPTKSRVPLLLTGGKQTVTSHRAELRLKPQSSFLVSRDSEGPLQARARRKAHTEAHCAGYQGELAGAGGGGGARHCRQTGRHQRRDSPTGRESTRQISRLPSKAESVRYTLSINLFRVTQP